MNLESAFIWERIPQGDAFWRRIIERLYGNAKSKENPPATVPEYPDMEAVQKRFLKLIEFKREHCPDLVFEPGPNNFEVYYDHIEERWRCCYAGTFESPTAIFFSEENAKLLTDKLNSGEFEL